MLFATTCKLYSKLSTVGAACSWVVKLIFSLISYAKCAPVFVEHLCLTKLPVTCYERALRCTYRIVTCTPGERTCVSYEEWTVKAKKPKQAKSV